MRTEIKKWGNSAVVQPAREGWFDSPPVQDEAVLDSLPADEGDEEWQW